MQVNTPIRNAIRLEDGRFDCEVQHPVFGWIPFTASSNDPAEHGRAIWAHLNAAQGADE